jgi:D-galactarolactone cycloisomerase
MFGDARAKVIGVRTVLLSARYAEHEYLRWVGGTIRSWDAALVQVKLADGTTGLGEVGAGIMAAEAVPGMVRALEPYVVEREFEHPLDVGPALRAFTAFWARGGIASGVIGAVELAVLDAVGRRLGVPAAYLLSDHPKTVIEVYASGGLGATFEQVLDWAEEQLSAGFGTVKFRAMRDPATTLELLHYIAKRLPSPARFVLDAVQGCAARPWSTDDSIKVGGLVGELGARWYEEPAHADDVAGYARVRGSLSVPVSGVESYSRVSDFATLLDRGGVDIAQPDATFVGGASSFLEVADATIEHGVQCIPHVWGSGVTMAANLHVAAAHPNVRLYEYCTLPNPLRDALLIQPFKLEKSAVTLPSAPGLGVHVTDEVEAAFAYVSGGGHVIR